MDVVRHDYESVELEAVFVAMMEERCDEEFGVGCALEVAVSLEGQDRDRVGALLLADCGHTGGSIPQGLKPLFLMPLGRAKPKGLAYLEAVRAFARISHSCDETARMRCPAPDFTMLMWVSQIRLDLTTANLRFRWS